jgi:hypothetical protein
MGLMLWALLLLVRTVAAADAPLAIAKAAGPITIDGDLSDPAWQQATKFETWYETNVGDNVTPSVRTVGYVTYDSRFLYIAMDMEDPNPKDIRAPFGDHDQISGNSDDFAGVILDTRNDGKTGYEFFVTARGVQFDAVSDDSSGNEDASPDFFWDSASRINAHGWSTELRIPFSSLRYDSANPEQWGIDLYRNLPRERRYQIFSSRNPRGASCFVCNFNKITGLTGLPTGNHIVAAPYVTAQQIGDRTGGVLGDQFVNQDVGGEAGVDLKWNPTADMAVDATINPDFSQIESDVAVISTNERFAIFVPEKRPFFLEGVELFTTPIQAVYTRTITSPRWGARTTGKKGDYAYTALVTEDRGGGDVIVPSAFGSDFALQDFSSLVGIARVRRDFGKSYVSFLGTTRNEQGGAYNRVFGPDFQLRLGDGDFITGQLLFSETRTPDRLDLHSQWDGRRLDGHAARGVYQHTTPKFDYYINFNDYSDGFRADNGFVPQVGWRGSYTEAGRTFRPKGFFNRVRAYAFGEYQQTQDGYLLYRDASVGFGADGRYRSFTYFRVARDTVAVERGKTFDRDRLYYTLQLGLSNILSQVSLDGWIGDEIDFTRQRLGRGASMSLDATLRPTLHLQLAFSNQLRWLNIAGDRLFTAQVERLRATYTFNPRMFVRTIVQNDRTHRDTALYAYTDDQRFLGSLAAQLLFAYKLNWQTVAYIGAGDLQDAVGTNGDFIRSSRQIFAKLSYAFQR